MLKKIWDKRKLVTVKDLVGILLIFPIAYPISLFYKHINKNIVLIFEDKKEARDNAYILFKYISENYGKELNIHYVIKFNSPDYNKVQSLGNCIDFGSFKHWIFYLSAKLLVSSHKGENPCPPLFYVLQNKKLLTSKFLFLQHGITISDAKWLYYENTHFDGFVCGAEPEYNEIKTRYGYKNNEVRYLGFPRFDNLHNIAINNKQILLMPSWREWLTAKTDAYYKFGEGFDFEKSEYFLRWNKFLNNKKLHHLLEENDLKLIFYPHRNVQKHIGKFYKGSSNIIFASWKEYDIQSLLKESAILITDYSSVFMDFAYMRKPTVYYQFDYDKFREGQYAEGYFDYNNGGFGPVFCSEDKLIDYLENSYLKHFKTDDAYLDRIDKFFPLFDKNNSQRNYEYMIELLNK